MERYIWLLPTIFMFHDMEEIIGIKKWISEHYDEVVARIPMARKLLEPLRDISTARFAAAVYEELIVFIIICLLADATDIPFFDGVWLGAFVGFAAHLVVHIVQAAIVGGYVPALATSLISLLPSAYIIYKSWLGMETGASAITGADFGIVFLATNLLIIHHFMKAE
ncbi:Protein of unknown function with HXXEE motif-containing protein [Bacteroidales bacterium KHT7]|nr:Protein of unknown function with HXXEE motif-containing protein [Bacteroidales bacterium KHT7]